MNDSKTPLLTALASIGFGLLLLSGCSSADKDAPTIAEPNGKAMTKTVNGAPSSAEGVNKKTDNNVDNNADNNADIIDGYNVQNSRNNGAWGGVYMTREELAEPRKNIVNASTLPTIADDPELKQWHAIFGDEDAYNTNDGKKLYHESCAACHMHKGEGAVGAGYYPPLAKNSKMESKYYIIDILINGFRGMPSFHMMMDDEQMAAVTQYIRTDLNGYKDPVTAADVAQLRHAMPPGGDPADD